MKSRARLLTGRGAITAAIALAPSTLLACPVCFQADAGPVTSGIRAAVITLVAITGCVVTGFVVYLRGTKIFSTDAEDTSEPL